MLRSLFRRRAESRGFPLSQVTIGHARIGAMDVVYIQTPNVMGEPCHWYLGVDDDGIALAAHMTHGPLVPGAPKASSERMAAHLAELILQGREEDPDRIVRAFNEVEWDNDGRDLMASLEASGLHLRDDEREACLAAAEAALAPVAERLRTRRKVLTGYLRMRYREVVGLYRPRGGTFGTARVLTMPKAEMDGLLAMGDVALLRPAIEIGIRLDRSKAEFNADLLARLGVAAAAIRRVPAWMTDIDQYTALALRSMHIDWLPRADDREGWAAMATMAETLSAVRTPRNDWSVLAAPSKGNWTAFLQRCSRASDPAAGGADHERLKVAALNANHLSAGFHAFLNSLEGNDDGADMSVSSNAYRISLEAVVGDRALPAVLENSRLWHERFEPPAPIDARWEPLLPSWTHEATGIAIAPIVSSHALIEEGDAMDHCVGSESFALGSIRDEVRVLSLGRGAERLSTAEIALHAGPDAKEVVQHLARSNDPPCAEAERALEAYLGLPEVREAIRKAEPNDRNLPTRSIEEQGALLESWRPFLAGRWKHASLDDFRAQLNPSAADEDVPAQPGMR